MKSKTRTLRWTSDAVNTIIRYVDIHKGPNSIFLHGSARAWDDLQEDLSSVFDAEQSGLLSVGRIKSKLSNFWASNKLPNYAGLSDFWLHGTAALDPAKLKLATVAAEQSKGGTKRARDDEDDEVNEEPPQKVQDNGNKNHRSMVTSLLDPVRQTRSQSRSSKPRSPRKHAKVEQPGQSRSEVTAISVDTTTLSGSDPDETEDEDADEDLVSAIPDSDPVTSTLNMTTAAAQTAEPQRGAGHNNSKKRALDLEDGKLDIERPQKRFARSRPSKLNIETGAFSLGEEDSTEIAGIIGEDNSGLNGLPQTQHGAIASGEATTSTIQRQAQEAKSRSVSSSGQTGVRLDNAQVSGGGPSHAVQLTSYPEPEANAEVAEEGEMPPTDVPLSSISLATVVSTDVDEAYSLRRIEERDWAPYPEEERSARKKMKDIEKFMWLAVTGLLDSLNIRRNQPVDLDPELFYPDALLQLLATIMGCSVNKVIDRFTDLSTTENQRHVDMVSLVMSLLGSAIKHWCFDPLPQGEDFFEVPHIRAVMNGVRKCKFELTFKICFLTLCTVIGPLASAHVGNVSVESYIEEFVEPKIEKNAYDLARKFDRFMSFMLPNRDAMVDFSNFIDMIETYKTSEPNPDDGSQPKVTNEWQAKWLQELTKIFTFALKWRANAEKFCSGDYKFGFPAYMTEYERWRGPMMNHPSVVDNDPRARVLLTLMPTVLARRRPRLTDNMEEMPWKTVYEGLVLVGSVG